MAEKLRAPQQAVVGSKTRSAGRTPLLTGPLTGPLEAVTWLVPPPGDSFTETIGGDAVDIVVMSRHMDVSDRFRSHVEDKLARLEKHDHRIIRVEVEVEKARNPRQQDRAVRVELTAFSKGPVVRAEAAAVDKMAALDLALDKMANQMRRAADRRRVHRGRHTPVSVGQALAGIEPEPNGAAPAGAEKSERQVGPITVMGDGPLVVREKSHPAEPMTLDQALYEMELVGHDFYLFVDKESERPSVVYRRRGYDYGVISLDVAKR